MLQTCLSDYNAVKRISAGMLRTTIKMVVGGLFGMSTQMPRCCCESRRGQDVLHFNAVTFTILPTLSTVASDACRPIQG